MLQSEHIRALPADVKRKSIMVALDAAGVKVTEIVEDAVRRDRALDTYERVLQKNLEDARRADGGREQAARRRDRAARGRASRQDRREHAKRRREQQEFLAWQTAEAPGRRDDRRRRQLLRVGESRSRRPGFATDKGDADVR